VEAYLTTEVKPPNGIIAYVNVFCTHIKKYASTAAIGNIRTDMKFPHIPRLIFVFVWQAFTGCQAACGTTLIAYRSDSGVVFLGSDSLQVSIDSAVPSRTLCKIDQISSDQFVAFASMPSGTHYDALEIAKRSVASGNLRATADAFERALLPNPSAQTVGPLAQTVQDVLQLRETQNGKRIFDKFIIGPAPWISAVFVGFNGHESRIEVREFKVSLDAAGTVGATTFRMSCGEKCVGESSLVRSGNYPDASRAAVVKTLKGSQSFTVLGIYNFVNAEIKADPAEVGPPVNILVVEPQRAYWSDGYNDGCEAIK
jgi:hypothetical protein